VSIYIYGKQCGDYSSVLKNIELECKGKECPWQSLVVRIMFIVVVACHIPFMFFAGKEGVLIILDELDRKSISKALEDKLDYLDESEFDLDLASPRFSDKHKSF